MQTENIPAFLTGGGEIGTLMREYDWSQSPLGLPDTWPQALSAVVGLMLSSKFPMFLAWGPELRFLYNDSYAEILGSKHPTALGSRFQDIWSEIWGDIHPIIEQAMKGIGTYHENLPLTMNRKGYDEQTWFTFSYSPLRQEDGEVAGMFCVVTETTEQVLAERHRVEEYERLRYLFQQAPGVIAILREPDHVFEIANNAYFELVGRYDIIGKSVREALPEVAGQGFFDLLDRVYWTGEPYIGHEVSVKLQRQPGAPLEERFVNFVYQPTRDYRGGVSGIFIEGSDVTDAVMTNRALRESEERLRQLADTIPQLAWMADRDGNAIWYNDRWYKYTGTTFEEMQGSGWQKVVASKDLPLLLNKWQTAVATGEPYEITISVRAANGDYRIFTTRAAPLRDASGNIIQWFGTNTDITELQQAQEELRSTGRRKDEFLAMLAHELRNPLAPISSAADLLKFAALDEGRIHHTSNIIARQVAHMTKLVDDLLDVSRATRGLVKLRAEKLNINSLVAEAIEQVSSLMEAKRQHFTALAPEEPLFVQGDRTRLVQVFSNILNNAAKYTPPEGHITMRLRGNESHVEVAVEDDGIGIEPALQPHIFELFTQAERSPDRSQGGLGLGLTLVKSLVELQGGSVAVKSEGSGQGSEFLVRLPRRMQDEEPRQERKPYGDMPHAEKALRLMVVDDNQDAAQTLSLLLETAGYRVSVAHDAQHALALAHRNAPSIVFLDIGLPDIDGYQLARSLRALPETAKSILVAVTGYGQPEDKARAAQAGFHHHLIKPVKLEAILRVLSEAEAVAR